MMERIILHRLLYKVENLLSSNLHGFIRGKSTADCVMKSLSNSEATCRTFVDLKGAFDRANKEVILEELVNLGVSGKLLKWIDGYLSNRKARVWFQGWYSEEKDMELGTPQGGVLSPTLFNILMNIIARHEFPGDTQVIIYADDILLQCKGMSNMQQTLDVLSTLCCRMGIVINDGKTKYQVKNLEQRDLFLNGIRLEKVDVYKYLGMNIGYTYGSRVREIQYLENACKGRLRPLRALAWRGNGVGIPVLRMVYISTVRSLIDYAAPILIMYNKKDIHKLEVIQNEALRIVLGCPRNTRIQIMRMELTLPSIEHRIKELTVAAALKSIRRDADDRLSCAMMYLSERRNLSNVSKYARTLYDVMREYGVDKHCVSLPTYIRFRPWQEGCIAVDISQLEWRKADCLPSHLRNVFLEKIVSLPRRNSVHIYCDGSVLHNGRAGCGVFIREFLSNECFADETISKRISDNTSSTLAELHAICEGLQIAIEKCKNTYFFVDSISALKALQSKHPCNCHVVNICKRLVIVLQEMKCNVQFTWIPSHVGIHFNEVADGLARKATEKMYIDIVSYKSIGMIKNEMKRTREEWENVSRSVIAERSESLQHYLYVLNNTNVTYGANLISVDNVLMRLRLGYKYYCQLSGGTGQPCQLCQMRDGHTLEHYVLGCEKIQPYRNNEISNLKEQVCWMINNGMIKTILAQYKNFAPRL